jgi:uncharacterized membrane protein YgaE (UPF0421/DUF939 family)
MAAERGKRDKLHVDGVNLGDGGGHHRVNDILAELRRRSGPTVRDRARRVRFNLVIAFQAGLAGALAWIVAHDLIGNQDPVFAPIAAVGTLASSIGQRFRRTVELIIGVAVGIGIGDFLIFIFGSGAWQLGLVVLLAIVVSIFLGGGPAVVTQAASTAVLLGTLRPQAGGVEFTRVVDALVGGMVALIVVGLLLPLNPLRLVDRAARPALDTLAEELSVTAQALANQDPRRAQAALDRLREVEAHMDGLEEALRGGRETATLAPVRWRRRGALTQYVESAEYINHAVHNSGTLVRRAVTVLEDSEPVPPSLPLAVSQLADAVRQLLQELGTGVEPEGARERALRAVNEAGRAYADGVGFSGSVVVAQVRTTASDLLRATGIEKDEANRLVRRAVGGRARTAPEASPQPPPMA